MNEQKISIHIHESTVFQFLNFKVAMKQMNWSTKIPKTKYILNKYLNKN